MRANEKCISCIFSKQEKLVKIKKTIAKKLGKTALTQYEEAYIEKWIVDYKYDLNIIEIALKKTTSKSNPNLVAGALVNLLKENEKVEMHSIGAGAINQAIKAIAIARGFVAPSGKNLVCIPAFTDIVIDGDERTAIKLIVETK